MPHKKGHNKGITKEKKRRKREEAKARDAKTLPERMRQHRRVTLDDIAP